MRDSTEAQPAAQADAADIVGVGFGPANLALAVALAERPEGQENGAALRARFFEKQAEFGWHPGMLIDGATMQVSFLKDLATLRNPVSPFSFLSYLHARGRLLDFINRKSFFPLRTEYHDYLVWAAGKLCGKVDYGCEVLGLRPVSDEFGVTEFIDVVIRKGASLFTQRSRNVVLATGLDPVLPPGVEAGERLWHSSELLFRVDELKPRSPKCFLVVGAGQSAAEVVAFLHERFSGTDVHAVFARYGFSVADDSAFANQIFDPAAVDHYFSAPSSVKRTLFDYHANTNYSVVDLDLIAELYNRVYREKLTGRRRLHIHSASRLRDYRDSGDAIEAEVEFLPTGECSALRCDAVIFATGYRPGDPTALLGELSNSCRRDSRGLLQVGRRYRVVTKDSLRAGIYLQGPTEHSHGISSSLLSNIAVRAGEIADELSRAAPARRVAGAHAAEGTR
jgi:L-ornithine N5-monooxygenase